jgi:hypothetical protein
VKLKHGRILMGPISYGITWRLILLKVLHKPSRPIRIFIPKSKDSRYLKVSFEFKIIQINILLIKYPAQLKEELPSYFINTQI